MQNSERIKHRLPCNIQLQLAYSAVVRYIFFPLSTNIKLHHDGVTLNFSRTVSVKRCQERLLWNGNGSENQTIQVGRSVKKILSTFFYLQYTSLTIFLPWQSRVFKATIYAMCFHKQRAHFLASLLRHCWPHTPHTVTSINISTLGSIKIVPKR